MEYEIDSEKPLFDASTNPSLQLGDSDEAEPGVRRKREYNSDDRRRQRGEAIPEEDPAPQME